MAANQDEKQMYEDLVGFLLADRVDLRISATEAVLQVRDPYVHYSYMVNCLDVLCLVGMIHV